MDEADLLLDRPPSGWDDLVTKEWLHLELGVVNTRLDAIDSRFTRLEEHVGSLEGRFDKLDTRLDDIARELRSQTWRLVTVLVAGMGIAIGVARF